MGLELKVALEIDLEVALEFKLKVALEFDLEFGLACACCTSNFVGVG